MISETSRFFPGMGQSAANNLLFILRQETIIEPFLRSQTTDADDSDQTDRSRYCSATKRSSACGIADEMIHVSLLMSNNTTSRYFDRNISIYVGLCRTRQIRWELSIALPISIRTCTNLRLKIQLLHLLVSTNSYVRADLAIRWQRISFMRPPSSEQVYAGRWAKKSTNGVGAHLIWLVGQNLISYRFSLPYDFCATLAWRMRTVISLRCFKYSVIASTVSRASLIWLRDASVDGDGAGFTYSATNTEQV